MKFALLGAERDVLPLLAAIRASSQHRLVAAYETWDDGEPAVGEALDVLPSDEGWEALLHASVADAVIVCRCADEELRADQLRKLTQAAIPLIVVHPVGTAILAFELQMIAKDTGCVIVPYQPDLDHPALQRLFDITSKTASAEAPIKQVSVERRGGETAASADQQFARDALIIRQLVGRIDHVSALGAKSLEERDANLSVQMSAENGSIARWTMLPAGTGTSAQWTVHTERGTTTASMQADSAWTVTGPDAHSVEHVATADQVARIVLDRLADRQAGRIAAGPDWDDACRAIELLENVHLSARRGKTVPLYYEDISEDNTFKSLMTAGGCLILMLIVVLLPMLAAVETLLRPTAAPPQAAKVERQGDVERLDDVERPSSSSPFLQAEPGDDRHRSWFGFWPLLFCFLALFLCLQFLRLVTKPARPEAEKKPPSARPE